MACPERQFPDTAVVYVDEAGLYQCVVSTEQTRVKSSLIDVQCRESANNCYVYIV